MDVVPLGPGFAAELRGVTLADVASDDAAYSAAARLLRNIRSGVARPGSDRRGSTGVFRAASASGSDQGRFTGYGLLIS